MPRTKRNLLDDYTRVTAECPCPVCQKNDWCLIHNLGKVCICSRVESKDKRGQAGWYHKLGVQTPHKLPPRVEKVYLTTAEVAAFLKSLPPAMNMLAQQASDLNLSLDSLIQFYARYDSQKAVVVFPMFDAARKPIGCRYRRADGRKWSLKGGREGLFIARSFRPDRPVFIAEGPTDAATLVESDVANVIGRPNCSGGTAIIKGMLEKNRMTPVIILADPGPPGESGAAELANALPNPSIVLVGPYDLREYHFLITHKPGRLTKPLGDAILEGLDSDEKTAFRTIHQNLRGKVFDFQRIAKCL